MDFIKKVEETATSKGKVVADKAACGNCQSEKPDWNLRRGD